MNNLFISYFMQDTLHGTVHLRLSDRVSVFKMCIVDLSIIFSVEKLLLQYGILMEIS